MKSSTKGILAGIISNVLFGLSFIFSKLCLAVTSVSITLAYRFTFAFLTLFLIILIFKIKIKINKKDLPILILMALSQPTLYFIFENNGILYSTTSFASIMISVIPIVCILFGHLFLKEKVNYKQILFAILAVGGVILSTISNWSDGNIQIIGIILLIGAVFTSAIFNTISRKVSNKYSSFERTFMMFFVSMISFNLIAFFENINDLGKIIEPINNYNFILPVLYLGMISSVIAFVLVNVANTNLPVSQGTIFSCVSTVVSVFVGAIILKEEVNLLTIFATIIILIGVYFVQYFSEKEKNTNE